MFPGEVPDPHETCINSRTGHGSSARIRHSADNLPTGTLEIRDKLPRKFGTSPQPSDFPTNSRAGPGHHLQSSATRKAKTPETEVPGSCFFIRDSRGHTLNLASLDAFHAHAQADILTVNGSADGLQVRTEGALIANMRMRHGETGLRSLAAHCATSCHDGLPIHSLTCKSCLPDRRICVRRTHNYTRIQLNRTKRKPACRTRSMRAESQHFHATCLASTSATSAKTPIQYESNRRQRRCLAHESHE